MPVVDWVLLNRTEAFRNPALKQHVSPFPSQELIQDGSGLLNEQDFASHGTDFYVAFSELSPKPLTEYRSILDFGCGYGRFARMLKGHRHRIEGMRYRPQWFEILDYRVGALHDFQDIVVLEPRK